MQTQKMENSGPDTAMKACRYCGRELIETAETCPECGKKLSGILYRFKRFPTEIWIAFVCIAGFAVLHLINWVGIPHPEDAKLPGSGIPFHAINSILVSTNVFAIALMVLLAAAFILMLIWAFNCMKKESAVFAYAGFTIAGVTSTVVIGFVLFINAQIVTLLFLVALYGIAAVIFFLNRAFGGIKKKMISISACIGYGIAAAAVIAAFVLLAIYIEPPADSMLLRPAELSFLFPPFAAILFPAVALLCITIVYYPPLGKRITQFLLNNAIIVGIVLIAIVVGILRANFISEANLRNLLSYTATRFIIAVGVSGCLITRGTDLSAGRVAGLSACIAAILLQRSDYVNKFYPDMGDLPILLVLVIILAICAIIGAVNGSVVSILKVPPFIATLGMQTLVYGICLVYTGAEPIGNLRPDVGAIATGFVGNRVFSYPAIIAFVIGGLMWFLYNMTRHGKYMYAIGGNESAAEVAGVNVSWSKIRIYMLAACLYGVCGFLLAARSGGASVNTAMGYELEAIAGCTIGGVSVNGGVGKISGILIGVLVFEVLKIALQFLGVKTEYTYIVQGIVIITAVALDLRKYLAKK